MIHYILGMLSFVSVISKAESFFDQMWRILADNYFLQFTNIFHLKWRCNNAVRKIKLTILKKKENRDSTGIRHTLTLVYGPNDNIFTTL